MTGKITKKRVFLCCMVGFAVGLLSQQATATCYWKNPTSGAFFSLPQQPITINMSNRTAVGAVLAQPTMNAINSPSWPNLASPAGTPVEIAAGTNQVRCLVSTSDTPNLTKGSLASILYDSVTDSYYNTAYPQVGLKIISSAGNTQSLLTKLPVNLVNTTTSYRYYTIPALTFQYVRTSLAIGQAPSSNTVPMSFPMVAGVGNTIINTPADIALLYSLHQVSYQFLGCTMNSQTVTLPRVALNSSNIALGTGLSTTAGDTNFSVNLNCTTNLAVNATLTDNTTGTSGFQGVLLNSSSAGSASGIGVQVLSNDTPVTLGTPLPLGTLQMGITTFNFTARYFQYQQQANSGTVNSSMNITLNYP